MKKNLLSLSSIAAFTIVAIASSQSETGTPPDEVYYDSGCRTVVSHHVDRSGEVVIKEKRTCS